MISANAKLPEEEVCKLLSVVTTPWLFMEQTVNIMLKNRESLLLLLASYALSTEYPDTIAKGRAVKILKYMQDPLVKAR